MRGVRRSALAARQSGPVCRMDSHPRSTEALKREVSADGGGSLFSIMRGLWPYIWPADRRDLKLRVAVAMLLLLAAKLATIAVPFTFKWATDALTGEGSAPVAPSAWLVWALAAPIVMTIAYGGTRILMALLTQMRDGIFAQVAMNAVRRLAYRTFEHMHQRSEEHTSELQSLRQLVCRLLLEKKKSRSAPTAAWSMSPRSTWARASSASMTADGSCASRRPAAVSAPRSASRSNPARRSPPRQPAPWPRAWRSACSRRWREPRPPPPDRDSSASTPCRRAPPSTSSRFPGASPNTSTDARRRATATSACCWRRKFARAPSAGAPSSIAPARAFAPP